MIPCASRMNAVILGIAARLLIALALILCNFYTALSFQFALHVLLGIGLGKQKRNLVISHHMKALEFSMVQLKILLILEPHVHPFHRQGMFLLYFKIYKTLDDVLQQQLIYTPVSWGM